MLVITELFFKDSAGGNSSWYLVNTYKHTPYHTTAFNDMKAALLFLLYTSTAEMLLLQLQKERKERMTFNQHTNIHVPSSDTNAQPHLYRQLDDEVNRSITSCLS